jgi:oligosaccharide repeat unit polymerase
LPFILRLFGGNQLSNYVLILLTLFSLIPQTVVISYRSDYSFSYLLLIICFWAILLMLHYLTSPIRIRFRPSRLIEKAPYVILAILLVSVLIYSFLTTGLRLHYDLINVYEIREEARGFNVIFPFNYIISFADNALAFFAILLLHRRRYLFFGFVIFVIFVNFSITGTKQIIFVLICGVVGYYLIRSQQHIYRILIAAVALVSFTFIENIFLDSRILITIYQYRVLFIPAELHNSYFNFFQTNELDVYRQSILKAFFDSPYQTNLQFLLGEYSIGDITARANNGLFSDAYMNLGALGIFIYPFLIIFLLRLFDGVVTRIDTRLWFVLAIYISFVLLGMTLSTAMLTAGLLPFLLMMYSFPCATLNSVKHLN